MAEAIEESRRQFVRHNPAGELYRQLTRTDPLAGEVPLPDAEHALTTQRRQAELDSDHLPGLAAVLSTHAMTLRSLGRHDEAQLSALEATDIYLRLVQDDPLTYEPMLVHAWVRTAVVLGELGIERVSVLDLAVTIRRRLAQRDPDHEPALAAELAILARALAKQGRWPEAVASGTESFEIRRQLGESELTGVADSLAATEEFLITHLAEAELGPEHLAALRNAVDAHPATVAAPVLERRV
jgi:tetratricopeptide (TPR) repeat protein